jgi:hypothetical protein
MSEQYGYTVAYDKFLTEVMPFVPNVPEFVAINAIRNACIEFCTETRYVQVDHDPLTGVKDIPNYQIDTPDDTAFVDVIEGWYNNVLLIPKSVDELSSIYRTLDWRTLDGNPAYITRVIQPEIILVPMPNATLPNALTLRIALAPTRDSMTVDQKVWEHYAETIGKGARARLYMTPGQPYSNPGMGMQVRREFTLEMSRARRKMEKGLGRADLRIQFTGFV